MSIRIGIISEFRLDTVNYGNQLQAYALGRYLQKIYPECEATYIVPKTPKKRRTFYLGVLLRKLWTGAKGKAKTDRNDQYLRAYLRKRFDAFAQFREDEFIFKPEIFSWERLLKSDFDILIVGSDVVWVQERFNINRFTFLDFESKDKTRKIAYAASFGRAWIPQENKRSVQKCLRDFQMISVRESSAVGLLHSIGIDNAQHVLDPTLLFDVSEWERIERMPSVGINEGTDNKVLQVPYAFAYLLGACMEQKREVTRICRENGLLLVSIPYADKQMSENEENFGDFQAKDCSPQEWIWLIHRAEYVITNSFHGIVFSTIFERKFFAVRRDETTDINERIYDYLRTIQQQDKLVDLKQITDLTVMHWDYDEINRMLEQKRSVSENFLAKACMK